MNKQFIQQAEQLCIFNLNDIMKSKLANLKQDKHFTYTWYVDMLNLLKDQDLLRQFQENQL
ncbi:MULTISPECIES: hypothetical protein [unclassified Mucilaginibacter]|uniref:hypothetical protein n=1 Tax=unclassified Mucilaginibacter TaxID=2617802 RepID=UPI002AC8DC30|nr:MULTISPECIES: hypothetical protein [unclassified Mucilaginibacter]MEB0261965.1 hypothetical protein [Mucilaginibacter sp. 10I4]MEB0277265.1 hypothetical protein [Mucilaginibacter sp. 10B2]MEB0300871.1 hypothetical protein [Mucilaginibacter sp. 5C4]WPX25392.1 hypothetical protein RHM67_08960 [Mucilaginibacter sp. 5C4]